MDMHLPIKDAFIIITKYTHRPDTIGLRPRHPSSTCPANR
eukprot:SAG11_NODE_31227_length_293_cov_1.845361_1_plen_39_part_01